MDETDRAWLAGFFDGEGCVSATRDRGAPPSARIQIVQKDRNVLETIRAWFDDAGGIYQFASGIYVLQFGARADVLRFIDAVYPYAVVKKDKLRIARMLATLQGAYAGDRSSGADRKKRIELANSLLVRGEARVV